MISLDVNACILRTSWYDEIQCYCPDLQWKIHANLPPCGTEDTTLENSHLQSFLVKSFTNVLTKNLMLFFFFSITNEENQPWDKIEYTYIPHACVILVFFGYSSDPIWVYISFSVCWWYTQISLALSSQTHHRHTSPLLPCAPDPDAAYPKAR